MSPACSGATVSCPHVVVTLGARQTRIARWITDAAAVRDAFDRTIRASRKRRAQGCLSVAIDDFGVGFSPLVYLHTCSASQFGR